MAGECLALTFEDIAFYVVYDSREREGHSSPVIYVLVPLEWRMLLCISFQIAVLLEAIFDVYCTELRPTDLNGEQPIMQR